MSRLELRQRDPANGAAVFLGEEMCGVVFSALNLDETLRELKGSLDRIAQATAIFRPHDEPVHNHRDVVVHPPVELRWLGDFDQLAVDNGAHESLFAGRLEQLTELAFAPAHQRREDLDLRAFGPGEDGIGNLSRALALDRASAVGAMRGSGSGVEESEVVVDLGHCPNGRARVVAGRLLFDGYRGRQPFDGVDVRLLHQAQELSGVGGERLDVPALSFGVDGIEGERGFPRPRQTGYNGQAVARNRDVDVSKVVLAGAAYD